MTVSRGTVIVTGATRGIGRATVDAILECGGKVVAIARNEEALSALEASAPGRIRAVAADLRDVASVPEAAKRAIDAFGSVDGLVNCAGIARYEPVGTIGLQSIEAQLRVNLVAPLLLSTWRRAPWSTRQPRPLSTPSRRASPSSSRPSACG
jgi:NAD(P)-dependent dehydrogenase (short-subunit alcohol dehydrogenase family)